MAPQPEERFNIVTLSADITNVSVLESYKIKEATVYITNDGKYIVVEPSLSVDAHDIYKRIMASLYISLKPVETSVDPVNYIEQHIWKEAESLALVDTVKQFFDKLKYYIIRDVLGYGILDIIMNDDNIEEITVERYDRPIGVIHRNYTEKNILDTNIVFTTYVAMNEYIQRTMQRAGKSVTVANPLMDVMSKEGDRIMVTYGKEVSLPGPTLAIRKFPKEPYTITHLLQFGGISPTVAAYLWMLLDSKAFGLIVGETGSGKTTLINSLMNLTNPRWKVITIEETPELKMPHMRWQRMFTRSSSMISETNKDIGIMDLIRGSLRMRPDFEIVGEVRGQEAYALFQSAATGHGGLTTFHAAGVESALGRLSAEPINIKASQQMLLWFIAHITRLRNKDKKIIRRITNIQEIKPTNNSVEFVNMFTYNRKEDNYGYDTVDDIIAKSFRLKHVEETLGVDLHNDFEVRTKLLKRCVDEKANTIEKVFDIIKTYYE